VARSIASRRAQRGVALLGLLAVAVMAFAYVLTSRLNAASQFVAVNREHNAQVLAQAKQALIGWMALNAASTDANPGRLPCPEAPANYADVAETSQGIAAANCTLPAVGRLPWRTLGLEKLVDAAGEPLWYAVSPGWALPNSTATLTINADSVGQLALDGNEAVALVIAPGPALAVQAGTGCTAWAQTRPREASGVQPDLRNYLECENANSPADTDFVASRPGQSFNDQLVRISSADLMPALEAAIANRMQREIAPAVKAAAYTLDGPVTTQRFAGLPSGNVPLYPYPVPFADPSASAYLGVAGNANPQGLLPFNSITGGCTAPPPCTTLPVTHPTTVRSTLNGSVDWYSCSTSATEVLCEGRYREDANPSLDVRVEMAATFNNVAMGFRSAVASPVAETLVEARDDGSSGAWTSVAPTIVQMRMNDGSTTLPDGTTPPLGSVTIRFRGTLPNIDANGWGTVADFRIRINRAVLTDHTLLSKTHPTLGWFVRNEWYRNTYYAVAQANTGDWLPSLGCTAASGNCIRYIDAGTYNIRALLVLAGRTLPTQTRQTSTQRDDRLNYVETQNGDIGTRYEQRLARMSKTAVTSPFEAPWNDRVILVDWDPASPPNASQVVSLTPLRVVVLP
jgi:hypothetical protein